MKKVEKSLSKKYPILRLYKSDLVDIFNLFKDHSAKFEIVADGFELDDLSELNKLKKQEIVDFKIESHNPYFSVEFSGYSASIYLSDQDDIGQRGLADKIGEILSRRKSPLRFFATPWVYFPIGLIYLSSLFLIKDDTARWIIFLGYILFVILWGIWGFRIDTKKHSVIYLYDPSVPGFFKRNKDTILVSLIGAVAGSVITLIMTWLIKK